MGVKKLLTLLLLALTVSLAGCTQSNEAAVTGILDHSHRLEFPVGTVVTVQIIDATKEGSNGKKISEAVITDKEIGIPTPFMVLYDRGKIKEDHIYSVKVKIEDSTGKILYASRFNYPVITQGNPTQGIDLFVELVDG